MRRRRLLLWGGVAFVGLLVAGAGVIVSGVVPIPASSGHWKVTEWVLHYAMRRSVKTYSLGIQAPPLDDPALAARGAGHYAAGCTPCHGAPGVEQSPVALAMTPHPPALARRIEEWDASELFWIVRNGIKLTGMPAWPTPRREDEVWAVVAFLLRLPNLDEQGYRDLALGPQPQKREEAVPESGIDPRVPPLALCVHCHAADGAGRDGAFPLLGGQKEAYLHASLKAYATGARASGIMQTAVRTLDDDAMRDVAAHYAGVKASLPAPGGSQDEAYRRGREIAEKGVPGDGIPACITCHGPQERHGTLPVYPRLAGQLPDYLALQLDLLRRGERGGTPYAHIMQSIARRLSAAQIRDVAAYYGGLSWDTEGPGAPSK